MSMYIHAFESIEQIMQKKEWHELAAKSQNPYYLSGFIEQFSNLATKSGGKPLFLIYYSGQKAVGIAPILISSSTGLFRMRVASFLIGSEFDPDFIIEDEKREDYLKKTVDFLFEKIGCTLIDISLPSKTKSLQILKQTGKSFIRPYNVVRPIAGHSVLPNEGTWTEFEKRRGKHFRKTFQSIERKLALSGNWKVVFASRKNSPDEIYKDILEIEKLSWKQTLRNQQGLEKDDSLTGLLTAAFKTQLENGFRWEVAFLEISGKKIAYSFWYEYKETAFVCKTSFDNNYKNFYPGVYINNAVFREIFNNSEIKQIDLMTDLPFHRRWAPKKIPRSRIMITNKLIPAIMAKTLQNQHLLRIFTKISKTATRALQYYLPFM
jgi:hypothetical protein